MDNYTCLQTSSTRCLSTPAESTPDEFPGKNLVRQSIPRGNNLDFLTSPTILDNLVHPRENTEAVVQRCSVKKVFLEISQNSQENTCARVCFLIKLQASGTSVFL